MEQTRDWERVKELFEAGIGRPPAERERYLRDACGENDSLRAEVASLLSAYDQSDGLSRGALQGDLVAELETPKAIGPYKLLRKIGEGGMGQVWLAEQTEPIRRQVALKLIRTVFYDETLLRRFQAERQSLAMMDHPAIAKVFDAGTAPTGQPYFVMEYVAGEPITEYCDKRCLSVGERIGLFLKVCEGVQHAHQKAVIHRDLKPANILVVEQDGHPVPRIIDFGLAKALTPGAEEEVLATRAGGFVGTFGYSSPEQADPRVQDIDTRTDVYSLGVILYELLSGATPFDVKQFQKLPLDEVLKQLRERDAAAPSVAAAEHAEAAQLRKTDARRLAGLLAGDLDWITLKALEKDRARRYGTATELAADIERHLRNEPVLARPAGAGYRVQKYLKRHRVSAGIAAGLVVLLAGFAAVEAVQLRRITEERDRASRITDFMTGMFRVADPGQARGNNVTAREILDKASGEIQSGLAKDPEMQAQMMFVMGGVYNNLGLYPKAEELLRESAEIRKRVLGERDPDTVAAMVALARTLEHEGRYGDAEKLERHAMELGKGSFGRETGVSLLARQSLGWSLFQQGRYTEAEAELRQAIDAQKRLMGANNPDTLRSMDNLASTLRQEGRRNEAEQIYRQVLSARMAELGPDNPDTVMTESNLAGVLVYEGRNAEAEGLFRQVLEFRKRVLGAEHPDTADAMNNLAIVVKREGHLDEAQGLQQQALEIGRKALGPEHPKVLVEMNNLAETWAQMGRYAQAQTLVEQARAIQMRILPANDPTTAISTYNLAGIVAREGQKDYALTLLDEAVEHGLPPLAGMAIEQDTDLASLRGDPRFEAIALRARKQAEKR